MNSGSVVFILIGPFAGRSVLGGGRGAVDGMEAALGTLGDLILAVKGLKDSARFVLVPGEVEWQVLLVLLFPLCA